MTLWLNFSYNYSVNLLQILPLSKHRYGAGGMAESRWAGTLLIRKDHQLVGIHICPCPYQEETETRSFHYTNSLIGDIAMVIYM